MELLTGAPLTAFRDATITLAGAELPLMVQDYIGALNVYLALPALGISGIGVPNLRIVAILTGAATLLLLERSLSTWLACLTGSPAAMDDHPVPITLAGLMAITLLAASPSFIFWSRQGIFVTNLTQPLTLLCIWQGLRWLRNGRSPALWVSALAGGLALYAKLLAIWVVGPFALLMFGWWIYARRHGHRLAPSLSFGAALGAGAAFLLPLLPLLLFNLQTGGTWNSVGGNLGESYYGVNNLAIGQNFVVRAGQIGQILRGDHLWYLGGIYANPVALWAGVALLLTGLWRRPSWLLAPLLLVALSFGASLFTISDLFITHYALLHPLLVGLAGLSLHAWVMPSAQVSTNVNRMLRWGAYGLLALWLVLDLNATVNYHRALTRTGGLADHSDATYHLAYYLQFNGLGAPIALDWGLDAPVRYLSQGAVRPIEIFGYASPDAPDVAFDDRLAQFLPNPDNVYLLRAPDQSVFAGRREAFLTAAAASGLTAHPEAEFSQRDGTVLFELWRAEPAQE